MKLRRPSRPELTPENAQLLFAQYQAFEEGFDCCARLTERRAAGAPASELRPEALDTARMIAYVSRVSWEAMINLQLLESIPERQSPAGAIAVLARLCYALTALAEDEPEPETLLSPAELDGLLAKHGAEDWVSFYRELVADAEASEA
jgi:hypothetical protein